MHHPLRLLPVPACRASPAAISSMARCVMSALMRPSSSTQARCSSLAGTGNAACNGDGRTLGGMGDCMLLFHRLACRVGSMQSFAAEHERWWAQRPQPRASLNDEQIREAATKAPSTSPLRSLTLISHPPAVPPR